MHVPAFVSRILLQCVFIVFCLSININFIVAENDLNPNEKSDIINDNNNQDDNNNNIVAEESEHEAKKRPRRPITHNVINGNSILFVLFIVILCQVGIYFWRRKHNKSFFIVTLICLWLFPMLLSVKLLYWRMMIIWTMVSCFMFFLICKSRQTPMNRYTPRLLYTFFHLCYKITNILSIIGYFLFLFDFFGVGVLVFGPHPSSETEHNLNLHDNNDRSGVTGDEPHSHTSDHSHWHFSDIGIYFVFYGLYYGVLTRDTAQLCCDGIANALGFFNPSGFPRRRVPKNICAVCNQVLTAHELPFAGLNGDGDSDESQKGASVSSTERRAQQMLQRRQNEKNEALAKLGEQSFLSKCNPCNLSQIKQDEQIAIGCGHCFHGFCIRGWIMIGKRDICPVCKEKVNLKGIFGSPWQKTDRLWSQILDGMRYLLVWNPIIVFCANIGFVMSGMSFADKVTVPV